MYVMFGDTYILVHNAVLVNHIISEVNHSNGTNYGLWQANKKEAGRS